MERTMNSTVMAKNYTGCSEDDNTRHTHGIRYADNDSPSKLCGRLDIHRETLHLRPKYF